MIRELISVSKSRNSVDILQLLNLLLSKVDQLICLVVLAQVNLLVRIRSSRINVPWWSRLSKALHRLILEFLLVLQSLLLLLDLVWVATRPSFLVRLVRFHLLTIQRVFVLTDEVVVALILVESRVRSPWQTGSLALLGMEMIGAFGLQSFALRQVRLPHFDRFDVLDVMH